LADVDINYFSIEIIGIIYLSYVTAVS